MKLDRRQGEHTMKTFTVTIESTGLGGTRTREHQIKAKNEKSARSKAWLIIGDQSGQIMKVEG